MTKPILQNYDTHVNNFISFLSHRLPGCQLLYLGPEDLQQHILQKTVYACSVSCLSKKYLQDVFPVMIGSQLDLAIRHKKIRSFPKPLPPEEGQSYPFQELDIATGFFLINGFVRHIPYLYTNDPTNTHMIRGKGVRVYSYNALDRGKELNYYVSDNPPHYQYGDVLVVQNDGTKTTEDPDFFAHCPHPVHLTAYMHSIFKNDVFDIDHLGNKMVVSPGHLMVKLFIKYLYGPLREKNWKVIRSKATLVRNSIESGTLLHVLSRKTLYYKEGKSAGKMTNEPQESHREIGADGEVFVEKNTGCYREISTQTYPLNPFLLYMIVRQISKKVNRATLEPFHPSHEGWFCRLGVFDMKNVGRINTMVRDTIVSACNRLDPVYHECRDERFWKFLDLDPQPGSPYYVVVNEACIPVTRASFDAIDLLSLKRTFEYVECYERGKFIVIRLKMGLIMKRLPETDLYVTPVDEMYWARRCFQIESREELTRRWPRAYSYVVDLNPFFLHNAFLKNILAFNSLKNAVLATTSKYAYYFMDSVSTYRHAPSAYHTPVMVPEDDGVSPHFALLLPQVPVAYMSFQGITQEDCIAKRRDFRGFDCFRFYTLRFKVTTDGWVKFYPVTGDVDEESNLLGTVVGGAPLKLELFSVHVKSQALSDREYRLHFAKKPFRVVRHFLVKCEEDVWRLTVSVEQEHLCSTGDKLCSLHGQKGVIREVDAMPRIGEGEQAVLLVNTFCLFRTTCGQIVEMKRLGGGRDVHAVWNSDGTFMKGAVVLFGKTYYFVVVYFSNEHMYAPDSWKMDKVIYTPVKGRSRNGGMKLGNMEMNALRGNGIACCFEQKFFEDGDRVLMKDRPTEMEPQAINLVKHDFEQYKILMETKSEPTITLVEENAKK